jgi:lipopolysaccharide transport system ATP-binding protein
MTPSIVFDGVWKKFRKGERHDSLRDLIPSLASRMFRRRSPGELGTNEFWVLKDVSFEVRPGEALGIIGQNGAGKSTSLKLLTRILRPTRGVAAVRGRVGAMIEIAAGFHPDLTGRENVYLQGAIMGMRREEIKKRFDAIVAFAGLDDFIDTQVKRYSSGMNARLGFSVAAHLEPDVLLIDEVLAVGDFTFQQKCYERLNEFKRQGTAIAFVSHNMQAVATLCSQGLLLRPNQSPILADVATVTAAYAKSGVGAVDPRVEVTSVSLDLAGGKGPLPSTIPPGQRLCLSLNVTAKVALPRCLLALQVMRSDGIVMFAGLSTLDGAPARSLEPGDRLTAEIEFSAHVLRGTYLVNVHLMDDQRFWDVIIINGLGSFVVVETTRPAGVAELHPTYKVTSTAGAAPETVGSERQ